MKLKIWKNSNITIELKINKRYKQFKKIIPIGCDCHPAYMINTLGLRKESLPFDWLDTHSLFALQYAFENISSKFKFFLCDLKKNKEGKVYSSHFDFSLFFHYDDLNENIEFQSKLKKRGLRLLKYKKNKSCYYLHTVTSSSFKDNESVVFFLKSVANFKTIMKINDYLAIYLRYDNSFEENKMYCEVLLSKIIHFENVKIVPYIMEKEKFGIWGNETTYKSLIKILGIKLYPFFPKVKMIKKVN